MKPFVIGLVLGIAVLAAGFLTPALLPQTIAPKTVEALETAELARRQLHSYDASLPLAGARSELDRLKEADYDQLIEQSQEQFASLGQEFSARVRQAKNADREHGMPEGSLRAASANPSGVKAGVSGFEKSLRENQKHLDSAGKSSRSATQSDNNALGVGQVRGSIKMVEAAGLLAEARQLRVRLTAAQAAALRVATEWAADQAEADYAIGLDVSKIEDELGGGLGEIKAALAETQAQVDELRAAVAEHEQALAAVRGELDQARAGRLSLEEMGFTVGDDASFDAYRTRYLELSRRLQELQDQEQLLAFGGIRGGSPGGDNLAEGRIEGGEPVVGLGELRNRLAIAEDKLTRYTRAQKSLENQIALVGSIGTGARSQQETCATRQEALERELEQIREQLVDLGQQAFEKEDVALRAAREAVTAFKGAKRAADQWTGDASTLQREKDTQRTNQRLKLIVADSLAGQFANNSEAGAKTLVGRIQAERALALATQLDTLARIDVLMHSGESETAALRENFETARDEAVSILNEAREAYERLAQGRGNTSWVHRASLATVCHLLWQIDAFNTEQHRSDLVDQLGQVVDGRQQSPHLQQQVALHALVTGGAAPASSDRSEDAGDPDAEAADEYEEE